MRRPDPLRLVPVWLLFLALPAVTQVPPGQLPGNPSIPAPSGILPLSPGDLPIQHTVQQPPVQKLQVPLTPEEEGDVLQAQKRYQVAIAAYSKVKPATAEVWNKMGIAYQMMFNIKDAQRCYKESMKLNPRNAITVNNLATTYDSTKQYKQAEKTYRKALKISPNSAIILKNLGTNLLTQHKYSKGLEAYKQAVMLDPDILQDRNSPRVANPANVQERGALNYYMALGCLHSGQTVCALEYLRHALNEGFVTPKKLATDDQFLSLRDNPAFQQMLADQQQRPAQKQQ
jgi:tetratricopeptide (TPR) repeat protein